MEAMSFVGLIKINYDGVFVADRYVGFIDKELQKTNRQKRLKLEVNALLAHLLRRYHNLAPKSEITRFCSHVL